MPEVKNYACAHCGAPIEMVPPDEVHTRAMSDECDVCALNGVKRYVPRNYECLNCHESTLIRWHTRDGHTLLELTRAKQLFKVRDQP